MIRKSIFFLLSLLFVFQIRLSADEGMWLLSLLKQTNYLQMKKMGLKLTAEQIYSVNHASLKDAVVALDHGSCTAEVISADGLLLTNHHCSYNEIQSHSSVAHDYLKNGFWAYQKSEELPNPGKTATFLIRMEDVSSRISSALNENMTEEDRNKKIKELSDEIIKEATEGNHYEAKVKSFFDNNQFFLFVLETFKDVRLVGAPPESIGKFGHDTDNWMWPRHTGDFSLLRIYTAPDGSPAEYSEDNIPLKAKYHFPISLRGVKENDFTMVMGYPGTTERFLTSFGVQSKIEDENPIMIKVRTAKLDIIREAMESSDELRIKYASKYSSSSNYWKYAIGQNQGLKKLKVFDKKKLQEEKLRQWIDADPTRKAKYALALDMIRNSYEKSKFDQKDFQYWMEALYSGAEIIKFAVKARRLESLLSNSPEYTDEINAEVENLKEEAKKFYKDFDLETDKKLFIKMLSIYSEGVEESSLPDVFHHIKEEYKGDISQFAEDLYGNSIFASKERFSEFLNKPVQEPLFLESDIAIFAFKSYNLYAALKKPSSENNKLKEETDKIQSLGDEHFANLTSKADFVKTFTNFYKNIDAKYRPDIFELVDSVYEGSFAKFADALYAESIFTDRTRFDNFFKRPNNNMVLENSYILQLTLAVNSLSENFTVFESKNDKKDEVVQKLQQLAPMFYAAFEMESEKVNLKKMLKQTYSQTDKEFLPDIFNLIEKKYKGDTDLFVDDMFAKSIFTSEQRLTDFLSKPKFKKAQKDLAVLFSNSISKSLKYKDLGKDLSFQFMLSIYRSLKSIELENDLVYESMNSFLTVYFDLQEKLDLSKPEYEKGRRLYLEALLEMNAGKNQYPNANSTMRLTYGTVGGYEARDAVSYKYYTRLKGYFEKEDAENPEFHIAAKLKKLYQNKDYGDYGENGEMRICFTTNNDITGGNSGSPVLNAKGELIGAAFDGNWEAMSGDIAFEDEFQKCINVDIRYVLFIIDKFAGAKNLIDEMTIVK